MKVTPESYNVNANVWQVVYKICACDQGHTKDEKKAIAANDRFLHAYAPAANSCLAQEPGSAVKFKCLR